MDGGQNQKGDFIKKREQFTVSIRKQNREQIISKRRNLGNEQSNNIQMKNDSTKIDYVVDSRFQQYTKKFQKSRFHLQNLPQLLKAINDQDIIKQHYGAIGIRRIMSLVDQPPIQAIIDSGVIPRLIQLIIQQQYPQLQLQATWALANVASGNPQQCQSIINKGAIQLFIKLVKSQHPGIVQQAIWAIGNIASDSSFNRDALIRKGAIPNIIYCIHNINIKQLIQPSLWALSNLCRGSPLPNYQIIKQAVFTIGQMIPIVKFNDQAVFADCCWAISYNFPKRKSQYEIFINKQFINAVSMRLKIHDFAILVPVIRTIGHLTKASELYIGYLLQNNVQDILQYFYDMLNNDKKLIRLQTCWVLSNITSSQQNFINKIIGNQKLIGKLLQLFQTDNQDVKKQLCYVFGNLSVNGNAEIIYRFYKQVNIIKFYLQVLTSQDSKLILDSLDNLHSILEIGEKIKNSSQQNPFIPDIASLGGLRILEQLQTHQDQDVYNGVVKIMKDFFEIQDGLNL